MHVLVGHRQRGVALVRRVAGEHFVEHHCRAVHIAARGALAGGDLFGGQVRHCAQDHVFARGARFGGGPHQPEITDLDGVRLGAHRVAEQHVLRLDVPVDQPDPVRRGQRGQHPGEDGAGQWYRQRAPLDQQVAQRAAFQQLHHQVHLLLAVRRGVYTLVVDRDHVRVMNLGGGTRLALEPFHERAVVGVAGVHHLDRHRPVQPGVQAAPIHRRHATARELGIHPIPLLEYRA